MDTVSLAGAALSIVLSAVVLGLVVLLVWWLDRYEREPLGLVFLAFVWGAVAAPFLSLVGELPVRGLILPSQGPYLSSVAGAVLAAPFIEELAKGVGLFLLVGLSRNVDNATDGMVYGTAVGLGFATAENVLYGLSAAMAGGAGAVVSLMLGRTILSAGIHALSTSLLGGALGAARLAASWPRRFGLALAGLVGAVGVHAGWNLALVRLQLFGRTGAETGVVILAAVFLELCFVVVFFVATAMDHRILLRELSEEVELGVLPAWVAEIIPFYRRRIRGAWWPSRQERTVLCRLLTRLAFRKHALRRVTGEDRDLAGLEVVQLRKRLREILGSRDASTAST